jgi:hypothetical protein
MERAPTARVEVVNVAIPLPFSVPDPSVVEPSLKATVPVGTPLPGGVTVTVAVNVTGWLKAEGLDDELTAVVVAAAEFTTWGAAFPLLLAHPLAPVKVAVMVWLPAASAVVLNEAWPAPSTVTFDARTVDPSLKVTAPTGRPPLEVVVDVKVTNWPDVEGFGEELAVVLVALVGFWTDCTVLPLLAAKFGSEAKTADTVWLPGVRPDVLKEATPLLSSGTCPSTVFPSWKVTMPVGFMPEPGGAAATVAVKTTSWPGFEEFGEEASPVVVPLAWTNWTSEELPALKFASPL